MIKILPKLYKLNSNNKIYTWSTKVEDKYVYTYNGIQDGKIKENKREILKCGRENSIFERAVKIAEKKWNDKINKEGYSTDINNIKIFVSPMLAKKAEIVNNKFKGISFPLYVQPKLDGFRCLCIFEKNKVKLVSRKNIEYIGFNSLKKDLSKQIKDKSFIYDGELYIHNMPFEVLSGHIKKAQHREDYDIKEIQFRIFDCFNLKDISLSFQKRYGIIPKKLLVETLSINSIIEFKEYFSKYIQDGYEGIMLRVPSSPYEISKRSSFLQKYKEFIDDEFEIVGFEEGAGVDKNTVIWVCKTKNNITFNVRPVGSVQHRKKLFKNAEKYIGKMLTIKFQELSENGVPRFPVGKDIRDL